MSELVHIIINKPEWATKINDAAIVETWKQEIAAQGVSPNVFRCVLQLLQDYKQKKDANYEDDAGDFEWTVKLGVDLTTEVGCVCDCDCDYCVQGVNSDQEDDDDDDEEDDEEEDDYEDEDDHKHKKTKLPSSCICTDELRISRFQAFLDKFVIPKTLDDAVLKGALTQQIAQLESTFTEIDYHPGSDNQVIDLIHPSLHCYVKDVTVLRSDVAVPIPATDAVFQWLPAEFSVQRNADNSVQSVSIDSYINNLPREQNEGLYQSIASVFGKLVPQFDQVLASLHESARLRGPSTPSTLARCQVIVKLANIVVGPGQVFPGGHWHLEGMHSERIAATGIYYYDMTNLQDNALQFRSTVLSSDIDCPQDGTSAAKRHYGMVEKPIDEDNYNYSREMESTISLGEVQTTEDMLLAFPNFLQHKVSEVRLQDEDLLGMRKILCFFLINPYEQVLSTAHVAPQQGAISLEDAKLYRELLMFQRKYQIDDQTTFFERGWSLCEH